MATRSSTKKKSKKGKKKLAAAAPTRDATETKATFEECLEWCIGQIECGFKLKGGNKAGPTLKILTSDKQPKIKKVAMMKQAFGDYRKLMQQLGAPRHPSAKAIRVTKTSRKTKTSDGVFFRLSTSRARQSVDDLKRRQELRRSLKKPNDTSTPASDSILISKHSDDTMAAEVVSATSATWRMASSADSNQSFKFGFGESSQTRADTGNDALRTIAAELRSRRSRPQAASGFKFNFAADEDGNAVDSVDQLADNLKQKASISRPVLSETKEFRFNFADDS